MKLLLRQHYLRLSSAPETEGDAFTLCIATDLKALLREWGPTTRISPIWRLKPNIENSSVTGRTASQAAVHFLSGASPEWFAGQLSPEGLSLLGDDSIFLTLGSFSLIVVSYFEDVSDEINDMCTKHGLPYEVWYTQDIKSEPDWEEFSGDLIVRENPLEHRQGINAVRLPISLLDNVSIRADDTLGVMALELYALLSVIQSRSPPAYQCLAEDCKEVEHVADVLITAKVEGDPIVVDDEEPLTLPQAEPQDLLLTLNAALSRHASQALSGTSPILRTECHFWPHSLLGTGVANLALRNLASFITKLVTDAKFHETYKLLLRSRSTLEAENGTYPDTTHLRLSQPLLASYRTHGELAHITSDNSRKSLAPVPITYYSGRDGFTNNALTVSAPLSCVTGCASYQWNLGTITHELSHRIVSGKLQVLFRRLLREVSIYRIDEVLEKYFRKAPDTVAEHAARLAGMALFALHIEDYSDGKIEDISRLPASDFFKSAKERYSVLVEETLVHIFDYYHFYRDPKLYVDFVWLSWAVQPTIVQKGDEYIKRTLVALAAPYVSETNWQERALEEFAGVLDQEPLVSALDLQPDILTALSRPDLRIAYQHHLEQMQYVLNLFHLVFRSDVLKQSAYAEEHRSPHFSYGTDSSGRRTKVRKNYSHTAGVFLSSRRRPDPPMSFSNPFRFLREFSRRGKPNAALSAWLLHMLAFNYVPSELIEETVP